MKRVVWIISEGSPGHMSQSEGLVSALAQRVDLKSVIIQTRPRLNGFGRNIVRWWMGRSGRPLPSWVLRRWLRLDVSLDVSARPNLIVSSGGRSIFAARSLAALHSAPYVFLGERKPYPSEWFHTILTPSAAETDMNDVRIEMIPTQVTREGVEKAAAAWIERPAGRLWAMVIGGTSVSHRYVAADWDALAASMNALARREGIRWLVTTSRRTGAIAEARLRASLSLDVLAANVWWADKPEKKMHAFLGAAECVVVTQDSVTMVTEAVASSRPVLVVKPQTVVFRKQSFIPKYIEALLTSKRIDTLDIASLATYVLGGAHLVVRNTAINDELAEITFKRLSWIPEPDET